MNISSSNGKGVLLDNHAKARNLHWPQQPSSAARILKCFFFSNSVARTPTWCLSSTPWNIANMSTSIGSSMPEDCLSPPEDHRHVQATRRLVRGRCSRERNAVSTCEVNFSMWMAPTSLVKWMVRRQSHAPQNHGSAENRSRFYDSCSMIMPISPRSTRGSGTRRLARRVP